MIVFENVSKSYPKTQGAVQNVSFEIKKAEIFGILGESGAGKSTILKMINQLESQDEGNIYIDGINISQFDEKSMRKLRKKIGVIFQNYNLLYNKTVFDNIALALQLKGEKQIEEKVLEALDFVHLRDKKDHYPKQLSGGEAQRVAIARAIVTRPEILLCDEATSALDLKTTQEILNLLKQVQEEFQTTIVFVTHELHAAKAICDRVAVMQEGSLQGIVDVKEIATSKQEQSYYAMVSEVMMQ